MSSFGILRTNVGLTTNVKIVVDSNYGLSLDSIDSIPDLSYAKYKKFDFNKNNYYDELLPYFFDGLSSNIAFTIKYDDDSDTMTDNFSDQFDDIYKYGARNIVDNKNYTEDYEYFAPLYVFKNKLPKNFIIFRVDNPGILNIDKTNVYSQVFRNFKSVKLFDLTNKTPLGEWLDLNINNNNFYPNTPFEMSFTNLEFSQWNGIDYNTGGYTSKSFFLDDSIAEEKEIFELEKFIFDGYQNNKVVFPNILNFSFLFDDNPGNSTSLNKWSINRYYGFYIDNMDLVKTISPYITPFIKDDVVIQAGNILYSPTGDPFIEGWSDTRPFYIEYKDNYYKVEKFSITQSSTVNSVSLNTGTKIANTTLYPPKGTSIQTSSAQILDVNNPVSHNYISDIITPNIIDSWKIVSTIDLTGQENYINKNIGYINSDNILINYDQSFFDIENFDLSDLWVIEIDNVYHNIIRNKNGNLQLNTDYSFIFNENDYNYYINKTDSSYTTSVSIIVDSNNPPKKFSIYRLNLTDIKDFDTRIVDTEPSKFEYEKETELTNTDESKLYLTNLNSNTNPKQLDDFIYNEKVVNIPVSSEYTANQETFKIIDGDLSPIWRKNPVYCRWGFEGSLSANDYPYVLNNSDKFEDYNRTTNVFDPNPSRFERNLDYFYTINSLTYSYLHHTLHVENNNDNGIDTEFKFDFEKYLENGTYINGTTSTTYNLDYFTYFFSRKTSFLNNTIKKNVNKYSTFISGDNTTPNITLFRGIKFLLYDVKNINLSASNQISVVNLTSNNNYNDYKFSILLTSKDNGMDWYMIDRWEMDKQYTQGSIVSYDDILYIADSDTICSSPIISITSQKGINSVKATPYNQLSYTSSDNIPGFYLSGDNNPSNSNNWRIYENENSILWNPNKSYRVNDVIYNYGDYYVFTNSNGVDFWNPITAYNITNNTHIGYSLNDIVIFEGEYYKSLIVNNVYSPDNLTYWSATTDSVISKWQLIEIWNPSKTYNPTYIIHNNILYNSTNQVGSNEIPGASILWNRVYSMESDTNFVYQRDNNPIINLNNEYYLIRSNPLNNTLENGIKIYINKKRKNVLINIYVNDNTLPNLSNNDRDILYTSINKKLTATNFVDCLNNLSNKYGFTDYVNYIIIDENGASTTYSYDNNIQNLNIMLFAERPEPVDVKINSLDYTPIIVDKLKPSKNLNNGKITSLTELNYYNKIHMGVEIESNNDTPTTVQNYNGLANISSNTIYRFSGNYMPIFYDVSLYKKDNTITYNNLKLTLEVGEPQNVIFNLSNGTYSTILNEIIYPGLSYSNISDYYSQITSIINNETIFSNINFKYDINRIGCYIKDSLKLDLEENTFNNRLNIWQDVSYNDNDATSDDNIPLTTTDVYPGSYLNLNNNKIFTIQSLGIATNSTFEFIVNSLDNLSYQNNIFFGSNDAIKFGFEDDRIVYFNNYYPYNTKIYSEPIVKNGTWYHLTFTNTYDGTYSYPNIYIDSLFRTDLSYSLSNGNILSNGGMTGSQTSSDGIHPTSDFIIGAPKVYDPITSATATFCGNINTIRVYDRVLTQDEIYSNYVNQHKELSITYKASEGNVNIGLERIYPSLVINIEDSNGSTFDINISATGLNPPHTWSFNGSNYTTNTTILSVNKGTANNIIVKDIIGLTSSIGYYTINNTGEQYPINGTFIYN